MNVLSLFDGISCGQLALQRAGIKVDKYYASEIKEIAIKVTQANFPNTIQLGDVRKIDLDKLQDIDLLIGGSPCQDLSIANVINKGNQEGLEGKKSSLFYEYVRILKQIKPKYFLLENVANMKEKDKKIITAILGVEPIKINSNLVSYQNRNRYYWTNIPNVTNSSKINCITCRQDRWKNAGLIEFEDFCRFLTTRELEQGQTLPIGYTKGLTKTQAANVIGDGWTVDVIAHIFENLPNKGE